VSYAGGLPGFMEASRAEAVRSLAKYLGTTETRARDLLADPDAYAVELRARGEMRCPLCPPLSPLRAYRQLLTRLPCP
jgi:hypothetical protein